MRRAGMAISLVVLAFATLAAPQESPQAPVFPARAERVLLDLVVRDKSGRPVEDLRADEVRVLEDGRPCAIDSFRLVRAEGTAESRARTAPVPAPAAPAAAPTRAVGEGLTSVVGIVFDQLGPEAAKNARAAALQLANRPFPRGSVFAVLKIGQGLSVLQSFTEDRALLPVAIDRATTGADQAREPARRAEYDNATEEALSLAQRAQAAARAKDADARFLAMEARMSLFADSVVRGGQGQASLQPMLAIARSLAAVEGRKSLLYFSEGLAVPPEVEQLFQATVSEANRANVSVYAFDARGLRVRSPSEETKRALDLARETAFSAQIGTVETGEAVPGVGIDPTGMALDALRLNRQGVLRDLAESTGGFLVAETNDLRPGLERVITDLRAYYEVGYAPPNPKADGRWRSISVKVSRPGVVVRTRRGYYAFPAGSPALLPYALALGEALVATPMPHDVEHQAATLRFAGGEAKTDTLVWVEVPLAGLTLSRGETTYRGHFSLLGQVKDEKGALVARLSQDIPIEGPVAEIDDARQRTSVVKRTLRLPPGRYVLETAVQDRESGQLGARRAAFEVPAPGPSLQLGSVSIVRADAVAAAESAADDPLRAGAVHATPLLGRSFPEGTSAVSLLLSLYAGPSASVPALDLELRREGQAVAHVQPTLPAPDASGRITYVGSVPAAELKVGRYEVWARARLGDDEATEVTGFTIAPRAPVAAASRSTDEATPAAPAGSLDDRRGAATPLATILERAGRYVVEYEQTFRDLVAEETYRQWEPNPRGGAGQVARTLRSDLVFVRLPGPLPWGTFRDVFEVDGQKVRDRQRRLEKLFFSPRGSDYEQAQAILNESSRYNLGRPYRNVNVPNLGLLFLRPENQKRLAFKRKGARTIAGFPTVEIAFEEKATPTLVHDHWGNDVPASGRFWIDETRGTVLRTEVEYDLETDKATREPDTWERGLVSTEYRREVTLECFVPDTMTELYNFWGIGRIDAVARYASYRRFEVSVGTAELLPLTYGPGAAGGETLAPVPPQAASSPEPPPAPEPAAPPRAEPAPLEMKPAPELPRSVGELLQKAGDYVVRYEEAFRIVMAVEDSEQVLDTVGTEARSARERTTRRLRSEIAFAMLPGPIPWAAFRDVIEVDGRPVRQPGRLEQTFRDSPSSAFERASVISRDSRSYSLGAESRNPIVPTMALGYLHPDNRDRFTFERRGRGRSGEIELGFTEVGRPAFVQDPSGADMPARGKLLIREGDGAVLRTEVEFRSMGAGGGRSLRVTTVYEPDPALNLLVPARMTEVYEAAVDADRGPVLSAGSPSQQPMPAGDRLEVTARYSSFHRVATAT